jgi:hypothetical protein
MQSVTDRIGKTPPQWLLEGIFIIVSVALGFAVAQYGEYRSNRELATRVLKNLQGEVEHNLALLEPMVPIHHKWVEALDKVDTSNSSQSGLDLYFATRPPCQRRRSRRFRSCGAARGTPRWLAAP